MAFIRQTFVFTILFSLSWANTDLKPDMLEIKALSDELLKNYSKYILPSRQRPFNVSIYARLRSVGDINEIDQMLSTVIWFYLHWKDEYINWNKSETNITYITLGWNDVWIPKLRVSNPHADIINSLNTDRVQDTVVYNSEGNAYFDEMMTTRTTCNLDMTFYPFDIQSCHIDIFLVGHLYFRFNLNIHVSKDFSLNEANHGSWTLINKSVSKNGNGAFKVQLKFKRRPLFILLNILLPIVVLALLTPVVFVLPKKSGERVGYTITMLLAISVYMTIVSDHLPQNSQPMPIISVLMFIWYILDALIVFAVIINSKINTTRDTKKLSYVSKKFVIITRKLTCHGYKKETNKKLFGQSENYIDEETANQTDNTDGENPLDSNEKVDSDAITWQELSHSIDKWCFVISYLLKLSLPVVFLSIGQAHSQNDAT